MAISTRLDLRQSPSLVMTPQLQQAIKLLQLSNMELSTYVEGELEENPLLARAEGDDDASERAEDDGGPPDEESSSAPEEDDGTEWDDTGDASGPSPATGGSVGYGEGDVNLEQTVGRPLSLREHLLSQVEMGLADPIDRMIGRRLVDMVDDAGYLTGALDTVADAFGCSTGRVEAALARLQQFDPPGVFARHLRECLALQLEDRNRYDPAMQALLDNLDLLARHDAAALMRACGVDAEDLAEMVAEIRQLRPKPGLAFDNAVTQPVVPDVLMRVTPSGDWSIELNSDTLPRVLVDNAYYARVSRAARTRREREYISERLQSANWLVKALHQRATTILRVATEIVRQQRAFFDHGVQHLRPLVLRDIAELIDMHESTVSRVLINARVPYPGY